jgi:hypothetical protein
MGNVMKSINILNFLSVILLFLILSSFQPRVYACAETSGKDASSEEMVLEDYRKTPYIIGKPFAEGTKAVVCLLFSMEVKSYEEPFILKSAKPGHESSVYSDLALHQFLNEEGLGHVQAYPFGKRGMIKKSMVVGFTLENILKMPKDQRDYLGYGYDFYTGLGKKFGQYLVRLGVTFNKHNLYLEDGTLANMMYDRAHDRLEVVDGEIKKLRNEPTLLNFLDHSFRQAFLQLALILADENAQQKLLSQLFFMGMLKAFYDQYDYFIFSAVVFDEDETEEENIKMLSLMIARTTSPMLFREGIYSMEEH